MRDDATKGKALNVSGEVFSLGDDLFALPEQPKLRFKRKIDHVIFHKSTWKFWSG
ncbi:hypothetical protein [Brytella acorum]|uniref:Uncharacterized protein n=1 Tax=Brytella acorum TaxID=2959299 RepID=A0AA35UYA7_9PROT|nr:hypothetical protein [Brytella acorum]MDF3625722.1 hypothetical protein [Brytella acorum]CAI9121687.1 hypothetical protein LMG32879_002536 [Brytella acorum]